MARRKKLHPIIRQIKQRLSQIATLKRTARMLGLDLSELEPVALSPDSKRFLRKPKRERLALASEIYAPPPPTPAPKRRRAKGGDVSASELDQLIP